MKICMSEDCHNEVVVNPHKNARCNPCKRMLNKYGITEPDRKKMYIDQGGRCKICDMLLELGVTYLDDSFNQRACVDHCHTTGKVRGILCQSCNGGLGLFKDNIDSLRNAIKYLGGK